jgi:hypothetical protein
MKQIFILTFFLSAIVPCKGGDFESYQMSWMGWAFIIATVAGISLFYIFRKRFTDDGDESRAKVNENAANDYKPIGDYMGGHPEIRKPVPGFVFRRNSHCCMFFYSNHIDNPPEFRFKIKVGSFRKISVEDMVLIEKDNHSLTEKTIDLLRKKDMDQLALLKINWHDGVTEHSTVFSFEGNDAVKKAGKAQEDILQALRANNQ